MLACIRKENGVDECRPSEKCAPLSTLSDVGPNDVVKPKKSSCAELALQVGRRISEFRLPLDIGLNDGVLLGLISRKRCSKLFSPISTRQGFWLDGSALPKGIVARAGTRATKRNWRADGARALRKALRPQPCNSIVQISW